MSTGRGLPAELSRVLPTRRLYGWWYIAIGSGFLLLAINRMLVGSGVWGVGLRLIVSAGFLLLGYTELKRRC